MAMPRKLKNFNIFNDANSYQGIAKNITLPALARKMEAYRGGGMNGPVKADLGLSDDGIQVEWTLGGWDLLAIRQWGATSASAVALRFTGAVQQDDTGATQAVEVVMRGRHEEIDFGNAEPGGDTEHSITTTCTYYKLSVDGEVLVEIDILNMVEIVNGEDILADQRAALGI
ncbi:major tail tube protein [Halopseudomonas oceani]|uniref:Phage major tail tube protein n=1 Tax=Halopseudomonas oceani TaxID=1708783 RepID=A0A2P4EUA1_9GAMM|nr:phage major tail tube protein [Halopseudomonas oceani]POB03011.1 phage major tail tube protein [Halopseudomonas oceani]GGE50515.1 major tail tube protein [Halopseudomonas oceani]